MTEHAHNGNDAAARESPQPFKTVPIAKATSYDPVQIVTEAYEEHMLPLAKEKVSLEKVLECDHKAARYHGHMSESEFRRFARAIMAGTNAQVLRDLAEENGRKAAHMMNGLVVEIDERFPGIIKAQAVLDPSTGAIFTPAPKITPPAKPLAPATPPAAAPEN